MQYPITIKTNADGTVTVRVPDLPDCVVNGKTQQEALERAKSLLLSHLQTLDRAGEQLIEPSAIEDIQATGDFDADIEWQTIGVEPRSEFSPREYMRARRPELYSDSSTVRDTSEDSAYLTFLLDRITERKDEVRFEHFCRKLLEKEICPNLIPQTGPTGGGDSKVDSETYPVSEEIAERWYVGDPDRASKERWAFAFSAKRDWRPKVRDDIQKIVETKRGYTKAYFVTNQPVSDRDRGNMEDELGNKWCIDVRIFDRNWISGKITTEYHYALFESTMHVSLKKSDRLHLGPQDYERKVRLEELDAQIKDSDRYKGVRYQLADDCLETALLARGLALPRDEIDYRFDRAQRISERSGDHRQLFNVIYHRAWTASCWHEDYDEFWLLYASAEILIIEDLNVWDLEDLVILWMIGTTLRRSSGKLTYDLEWEKHSDKLRVALKTVTGDDGRPTSALMAKMSLALMSTTESSDRETLYSGLETIILLLEEARNHLGSSFNLMTRTVEELINMVGGDERFDGLLEKLIPVRKEIRDEASEGSTRLQQAARCFEAGRHKEAIRQAGRAQILLRHGEVETDFVDSLLITAMAYEAQGSLWAARSNYAFALHWILHLSNVKGELSSSVYYPLSRLIWAELQLGRVPQVLCWIELHRQLFNRVELTKNQSERLWDEYQLIDSVLAIVILRTQWEDLAKLDRAPETCDSLGLYESRLAMLFMLGYESVVTAEGGVEDPEDYFGKLLVQPAALDVAECADWGTRLPRRLRTTLFGCRIDVEVPNRIRSLYIGETIVSYLESMFSTSDSDTQQNSIRDGLTLKVHPDDDAEEPLAYELVENEVSEHSIVITHRDQALTQIDERFLRLMMRLFAEIGRLLRIPISKSDLKLLYYEEKAPGRATITAQLPVVMNAIFGSEMKADAESWMSTMSESMSLLRTTRWQGSVRAATELAETKHRAEGS